MEAREDQDFDFNEAGVLTYFIHNNNHVLSFPNSYWRGPLSPLQSSSRETKTTRPRYGELLDVLAKGETCVRSQNSSLAPLKILIPRGTYVALGSFVLLQGKHSQLYPSARSGRRAGAIGDSPPRCSAASGHAKISFTELNATIHSLRTEADLTETLQDACHISPWGRQRSWTPRSTTSPFVTARIVASPSVATSPFTQPLIEAVDEDVHSGTRGDVTGSRDQAWLHPMDRGKSWEPAHGLAYLLF